VAQYVDFEAAKLKRKRMNSISGYKFYPLRQKEESPIISDRLTPYKRLTTNFIKKLAGNDSVKKPKVNSRILNGEDLI
jgi:hypothetical protein